MQADYTHLNAAGASLCSDAVVQAQVDYLKQEQHLGGYLCAAQHQAQWDALYQAVARLVGADSRNIALQESATRAMVSALSSIDWSTGDEIIITEFEYGANYVALKQLAKTHQLKLKVVPLSDGNVKPEDVVARLTPNTKAVVVTWVPSHIGTISPAAVIGKALADHPCYYLVDACQAVGQLPVDVKQLHCDFLCATGRKFLRAPRGTGFLFVSDRALESDLCPPLTDHYAVEMNAELQLAARPDAKRFELWEANWSARLGLKVALEQLLDDQAHIYAALNQKSQRLRSMLQDIPGIRVQDANRDGSAIITFVSDKMSASSLNQRLLDDKIIASVSHFDSGPLQLKQQDIQSVNRVSLHIYNTERDFTHLCQRLSDY